MATPFSLMQQLPGKSDLWLQLRGSEAARTALSVLQAHHTQAMNRSKRGAPEPPLPSPHVAYLPTFQYAALGLTVKDPPQCGDLAGPPAQRPSSSPLSQSRPAKAEAALIDMFDWVVAAGRPSPSQVQHTLLHSGPMGPADSPGPTEAVACTVHNPYSFDGPQRVVRLTS
eukprot:EG_transcript_19539